MRRVLVVVLVAVALACAVIGITSVDAQGPPSAGLVAPDSIAARRDSLMKEVLASIAGRENQPADSVFKNIKIFKGMPAGRVPRIMNIAFAKSLGVGCDHCHTVGKWELDDKHPKQIAREMWGLMNTLNADLLPKIAHLEGKPPTVNYTTCHRGQKKPALDLGAR